jgi:16S rRNA (cytosine967-C5)-methyltransferase
MEYTENQGMVTQFLQQHPQFKLEAFPNHMFLAEHSDASTGMLQILPHHHDSDGFFIARMRKNIL